MSVYFVPPAVNELPSVETPLIGASVPMLSITDCKPSTSLIVICLLVIFVIKPSFCCIPVIYFPSSAFLVISRSSILLLVVSILKFNAL